MREHATTIQKNRRTDSIVSIFNSTEPARRLLQQIGQLRTPSEGPTLVLPCLPLQHILEDLKDLLRVILSTGLNYIRIFAAVMLCDVVVRHLYIALWRRDDAGHAL